MYYIMRGIEQSPCNQKAVLDKSSKDLKTKVVQLKICLTEMLTLTN